MDRSGQLRARLAGGALLAFADVFFAVVDFAADLAGAFLAVAFGAAFAVVRDVALTPDALVAGAFFAVLFAAVDFAADLAGAFAAAFVPVAFAVDFAAVDLAAVAFVVDLAGVLLRADVFAGAASLTTFVAFAATFLTAPAVFDVPAAGDVLVVDRVGMAASSTASG